MDRYHHAIEEFHRQWEPYGGPSPEAVFTEFGLTVNQFYARHRALTRGRRRRADLDRTCADDAARNGQSDPQR
ncbi:hypothetical protein [Rhodococcus koreensis]|uniref:DUF3263 domain-containing protein n=1 Tax=Rhodococcus koreensis TaxID=99653 RepID=A0A1H4IIS1_9NOCA|nr:hypothetical protein [Rhodococcus koreensis]SEB33228.1 hypothetical protein SAMN04490239_0679 [Rhodococcus koreensis]